MSCVKNKTTLVVELTKKEKRLVLESTKRPAAPVERWERPTSRRNDNFRRARAAGTSQMDAKRPKSKIVTLFAGLSTPPDFFPNGTAQTQGIYHSCAGTRLRRPLEANSTDHARLR
jgi:hypothetical protein